MLEVSVLNAYPGKRVLPPETKPKPYPEFEIRDGLVLMKGLSA